MTNIAQMIGADSLLDVQWDTDKIHKVFTEILSLFNQHEKKINELNGKIDKKCEKEDFTNLENRVKDNEDQLLHEKEIAKEKFKAVHDEIIKQIDETQKLAEDLNLSTLGEARRLISTEIQAIPIPEKVDTNEFLRKKDIEDFDSKVAKIQSDLDAIMVPSNDKNLAPDVMQNIRILAVEKRCESIEQQLLGFSQIENDVNELLLSYPATTKNLERKINNLINQYEKPNVYKVSPRAAPPPSENAYKDIPKPQPAKPTIVTHRTPQKPSEPKPLEPLINTIETPKTEEQKEIEEENKNVAEMIEKPVEVELPPSAEIIEEMPALPAPPTSIHLGETSDLGKQKIEKITEKTGDNTVTVIENRTYTTELQSSMRVVTEIEWCKQLITQHHEAIRQLQNNTRTQAENYEHISDSLVRINSTHNSRISQLAQQQLRFRQEIDDLRKVSVEQFQFTKQKIYELENAPPPAPVTTIIEKEKPSSKPRTPASVRRSAKKLEPLPPLPPQMHDSGYYSDYNEEETVEEKEPPKPEVEEEAPAKASGRKTQRRKIAVPTMLTVSNHTEDIPPEVIFGYVPRRTDVRGKMVDEKNEQPEATPKNSAEKAAREDNIEQPPPGTVSGPTWPISAGRPEEHETVQKTVLMSSTQLPIPEHQVVQISTSYGRGIRTGRSAIFESQDVAQKPTITRAEIDEEVAKSASQFVRDMVENQNKEFQSQLVEFRKETDRVVSLLDQKIDRSFTERMFDKIRLMLSAFKGEIENMQSSFLDWVTREELEIVLQQFSSLLNATDDSAATNSKYTCLLCGRPKQHLAGMLEGDKTMHETRSIPRKTTNAFDRPTYQKSGAKSEMKRPPPRDPISYLTN